MLFISTKVFYKVCLSIANKVSTVWLSSRFCSLLCDWSLFLKPIVSIVLHICGSVSRVLLVQLLQMQENNKLGTKGFQFKLLYSNKANKNLLTTYSVFKGRHNPTDVFPPTLLLRWSESSEKCVYARRCRYRCPNEPGNSSIASFQGRKYQVSKT